MKLLAKRAGLAAVLAATVASAALAQDKPTIYVIPTRASATPSG